MAGGRGGNRDGEEEEVKRRRKRQRGTGEAHDSHRRRMWDEACMMGGMEEEHGRGGVCRVWECGVVLCSS